MTPHRQAQLPADLISLQAQCSPSPSSGCDESFLGDESQRELDLCEDEGLVPDPPAFTGLFPPTLFKSLLHKARATAQLGAGTTPPETSLGPLDPDTGLFSVPVAKQKEIPTPKSSSETWYSSNGLTQGHFSPQVGMTVFLHYSL